MKNLKLIVALCTLATSFGTNAQTVFPVNEDLDINLFKVGHRVHGDMWYNNSTRKPACEYPKGSGKHAGFATGLWISGIDNAANIRTATVLFDSDFMPGPLDASDTIDILTSVGWAKIWKVNQSDISTFLSLASKTVSTIPAAILEWPAKGNPYARGNSGVSLSVSNDMAPFIDVDANGTYDATKGDYPKMKGDQMLWWVINDNGTPHYSSKDVSMKLEIHIAAYAYSRGSAVDRMLFYEYTVHNRSDENYTNFRLANWADTDLGNPFDDLVGVDSLYRMGVTFQYGKDGPNGLNSYGDNAPITGLSIVEMPGDTCMKYKQPLGSITFFRNAASSPLRNPRNKEEFYNYMNASNADGYPMGLKNNSNRDIDDMHTSVCDFDTIFLGDKRFVLSSSGYAFPKNSSAKWVFAFMATDTNNHLCPNLKYNELSNLADTAWRVYCNPLPLGISKGNISSKVFKLYPNPAETVLFVDVSGKTNKEESIRIIDALGKTIPLPMSKNNQQYEINTSSLAVGVYSVLYFDGENISLQTFVKR